MAGSSGGARGHPSPSTGVASRLPLLIFHWAPHVQAEQGASHRMTLPWEVAIDKEDDDCGRNKSTRVLALEERGKGPVISGEDLG
uniref:Uncharacterized protein n=1 Tax=Oryza nivara TaxID=4536 RepID=A0A0E0FIX0_ORYNI